jgi:hypothetical protein
MWTYNIHPVKLTRRKYTPTIVRMRRINSTTTTTPTTIPKWKREGDRECINIPILTLTKLQ